MLTRFAISILAAFLAAPQFIKTERGAGYVFSVDVVR
jgi:hypothetical protein